MNQDLPFLRNWIIPDKPIAPPRKRIYTEEHVKLWTTTQGYQDYSLFYRRLSEAVVGHDLPKTVGPVKSEAINNTVELLQRLEQWVDEIPPQESPQRFGNLAFRDWGKRLEERADDLLRKMLPDTLHTAIPLLLPYLLQSFGSFTRMDYGSGHELSFGLFLCALALIRFYRPTPNEEREIVLVVFEKYLQVVWKLQDVYKLEPAGSHGVWGLDDYHFLTYLWGSAQLRDHSTSRPPTVLEPSLPDTNLYYQSINRIRKLKTGPFHEHSPQLHSIASSVATWWKVNQGMARMYEAEVLSKRVIVQHLPLGAIIEWDQDDVDEELEPPLSPPLVTLSLSGAPDETRPPASAALGPSASFASTGVPPSPLMSESPIQMSYQSFAPPSPQPGTPSRVGASPMRRPTGGRLATLLSPAAPGGEEAKRNSGTQIAPLLTTLSDEPEEMDEPLESFIPSASPPELPKAAQGPSQTEGKTELGANTEVIDKIEAQPVPPKEATPPLESETTAETPKAEKDQPVTAISRSSEAAQPAAAPPEAPAQDQAAIADETATASQPAVTFSPPEPTSQDQVNKASETAKVSPPAVTPSLPEAANQDEPAKAGTTPEVNHHVAAATGSEASKKDQPADTSSKVKTSAHAAAATGSETTNQKTSSSGSKSSKDGPSRVSRRSKIKSKANDVLRRISRIIKS